MNPFHAELLKFADESKELQKRQVQLQADTHLFNEKLSSFLKSNGLPENFTLPELALLVARKVQA